MKSRWLLWLISLLLVSHLGLLLAGVLLLPVLPAPQLMRRVQCYTNGELIYDHTVYDLRFLGNAVEVFDPDIGARIILAGDCIIIK